MHALQHEVRWVSNVSCRIELSSIIYVWCLLKTVYHEEFQVSFNMGLPIYNI